MDYAQSTGQGRPSRTTTRLWAGSSFALISAIAFAFNVACGPLVYEAGGNIHAVNFIRPVVFLAVVLVWIVAARKSLRLPSLQLSGAVLLGGVLSLEFYAVFSAVKYIPVGLAILVMYTYPLMVAILHGLIEQGRVPVRIVLILLVTFCGLALALATPADALDWRGVALAFGAALGMCALVMISERTVEGHDNAVVMFYITLTAAAVMGSMFASGVPMIWPKTTTGILALVGSTSAYVVATLLLFVSISMIGPSRFSAIDNTAPVWAILLGMVLLGEELAAAQWAGIALVVGGVIAVQFVQAPVTPRADEHGPYDALETRY